MTFSVVQVLDHFLEFKRFCDRVIVEVVSLWALQKNLQPDLTVAALQSGHVALWPQLQ